MLSSLYGLARPALFALEPEAAHEATLKALECGDISARLQAAMTRSLRNTCSG